MDANRALGLPDDCREYTSVRNILADLGVRSIRLMVRPLGSRQDSLCRLLSKGCLIVTGGAPATLSAMCSNVTSGS